MATEPDPGEIRDQILTLVSGLPPSTVHELFDLVGFPDEIQSERMLLAKFALIEYLNNLRPHRAQRLFMELFEPLLTSDFSLLRVERMLPGIVHRLDLACLWTGLSRYAFPQLVVESQHKLDALTHSMLIEKALVTPEARMLQDHMRHQSIAYIDRIAGHDQRARSFLSFVNQARLDEARERGTCFEAVVPIDAAYLTFLRDLMTHSDVAMPAVRDLMGKLPTQKVGAAEARALARRMTQSVEKLRHQLGHEAGGERSLLSVLLPLAAIHVRHRYEVVAPYLRETGLASHRNDQVAAALLGHFAACCRSISALLEGGLELKTRIPGGPLRIPAPIREQLEAAALRLEDQMAALVSAGFLENTTTEPLFRFAWAELARFFLERIAPLALEVGKNAMMARHAGAIDHDSGLWLVRFLWQWHLLSERFEQEMVDFDEWRDKMLNILRFAVGKATVYEEHDDPRLRLAHLARIGSFATIFQRRLGEFVSVGRQNVCMLVTFALERFDELEDELADLVRDYVTMARGEIVKKTSWVSPELRDLVRRADERGLTE